MRTIPLKFSVNFEEFSWRCTFSLKIFCLLLRNAPFCRTWSLQSLCLANFSVFLVAHFLWRDYVWWLAPFLSFICDFEAQMFQRKCGTQRNLTNILQILQRTSKALCLRGHYLKCKLCEDPSIKVWFYSMRQKLKERAFEWCTATYALVFMRQSL